MTKPMLYHKNTNLAKTTENYYHNNVALYFVYSRKAISNALILQTYSNNPISECKMLIYNEPRQIYI